MTIPFEEFKARLLADPKVKREYEGLAPEFEVSAELPPAQGRHAKKAARSRSVVEAHCHLASER
jgi:hypothetical protein